MLSPSFIVYGSQGSNLNKILSDIQIPKDIIFNGSFKDIMNEMKPLFTEIAKLNNELTANKVSKIANFKELSNKKIAICNKIENYIQPHINERNKYLSSLANMKLIDPSSVPKPESDGSFILEILIAKEIINTKESINNPNYVPEQNLNENTLVNKVNNELGEKLFLNRSDYIERSDIGVKPSETL